MRTRCAAMRLDACWSTRDDAGSASRRALPWEADHPRKRIRCAGLLGTGRRFTQLQPG